MNESEEDAKHKQVMDHAGSDMTLENVHGFYAHSTAWLPDLGIGCSEDDLF